MPSVPNSPPASDPFRHPRNDGGLSTRALWDWLGAGVLVSLLACYAVASQSLVIGSGAGGWVYGYVAAYTAHMLVIGATAGALAAALLLSIRPETSRTDWPALFAWMVLVLGLQALMRSLTPFSFERLFASDAANAFYGVTQRFKAAAVLRDFDRVRASWPLHAQSNMPGKLMLVYAFRNLSQDPAVLAWLAVVVSNLGAALMYSFSRELFADRRIAMYSAVLYLLMPAKLYFFPLMNSVTPVVVLACGVLVLKWLRSGNVGYAAALGSALFVLVFFEPLPLVMGLLFALFVLRAWWLGQVTSRQLLRHIGVGMATCVATYGALRLLSGFDLISAFRQIGQHAVNFNAEAGRPYSIWVWANLPEFLFGIGVCQAILFGAALMDGLRGAESWRDRLARPIAVLCLGTAAVLMATDVIGVNRGEVIRLWIFLGCFFQIPAAYVCARLDTRAALMLVLAVTILQATLGTAMVGFIVPG